MAKCGKRRYRDRVAALVALAKIQNRDLTRGNSSKVPQRAYPCPDCHGWHLTSKR